MKIDHPFLKIKDTNILALAFAGGLVFCGANLWFFLGRANHEYSFFEWVDVTYDFSTLYFPLGYLVPGLLSLALARTNRLGARAEGLAAAGCVIALALLGVRMYATHYSPNNLQIRRVGFETPKVDREIRLLHLSDIQSARVGRYEERVFETIRSLDADLIVHTGDLLQPLPPNSWDNEIPKIRPLIGSLDPPLGLFGVYGDCDGSLSRFMEGERFETMRMLEDGGVSLDAGEHGIHIYGYSIGESRNPTKHSFGEWLATIDRRGFVLALGHAPEFILSLAAEDPGADLALAGHTHGGQVRLPFFGSLYIDSEFPREYAMGFHRLGGLRFNVSAGIGCEHAYGVTPIRFFCPPDITLITLKPADET